MSNVCKILSKIILGLGGIGSIISAYSFGNSISLGMYVQRNWLLTIIIFIAGCFVTFISFILFYSLGEILEYLDIVNHKIEVHVESEKFNADTTLWTCNKCGKKNKPYVGTCSCGYDKI